MNYNYKLSKYKNKFLDQSGGGIDETIRILRDFNFVVEEVSKDEVEKAYVSDRMIDIYNTEYERAYNQAFNFENKWHKESNIIAQASGNAKKAAETLKIELESKLDNYRIFKVTRDDGTLFIIKLHKDYPGGGLPLICYNGKNIFKELFRIRKVLININPSDPAKRIADDYSLLKLLVFDTLITKERYNLETELEKDRFDKYNLEQNIARTEKIKLETVEDTARLEELNKLITGAEKRKSELRAEIEINNATLKTLEKERFRLAQIPGSNGDGINREITGLKGQIESKKAELAAIAVSVGKYNQEVSDIERRLKNRKQDVIDIDSTTTKIKKLEEEIIKLETDISKLPPPPVLPIGPSGVLPEKIVPIIFTDEFLDPIDNEHYYLLPEDTVTHLISTEEAKIDKLNSDFLKSNTFDNIYDINEKLVKRYRVLYKLCQRLFNISYKYKGPNDEKFRQLRKTANDKSDKAYNKFRFIKNLNNNYLNEINKNMTSIENIIRDNKSIILNDVNDSSIIELITKINNIFDYIYKAYNDYNGAEYKIHANIIKQEQLKYLNNIRKKIFIYYNKINSINIIDIMINDIEIADYYSLELPKVDELIKEKEAEIIKLNRIFLESIAFGQIIDINFELINTYRVLYHLNIKKSRLIVPEVLKYKAIADSFGSKFSTIADSNNKLIDMYNYILDIKTIIRNDSITPGDKNDELITSLITKMSSSFQFVYEKYIVFSHPDFKKHANHIKELFLAKLNVLSTDIHEKYRDISSVASIKLKIDEIKAIA